MSSPPTMLKITPAASLIGKSRSGEHIAPTAASSARLCTIVSTSDQNRRGKRGASERGLSERRDFRPFGACCGATLKLAALLRGNISLLYRSKTQHTLNEAHDIYATVLRYYHNIVQQLGPYHWKLKYEGVVLVYSTVVVLLRYCAANSTITMARTKGPTEEPPTAYHPVPVLTNSLSAGL